MIERNLICVACPRGCPVTVTLNEVNEVVSVTGNTCPRGDTYARAEVTHPERSLTSTVRVTGGKAYIVPVKSSRAIPKELLFSATRLLFRLRSTSATSPSRTFWGPASTSLPPTKSTDPVHTPVKNAPYNTVRGVSH